LALLEEASFRLANYTLLTLGETEKTTFFLFFFFNKKIQIRKDLECENSDSLHSTTPFPDRGALSQRNACVATVSSPIVEKPSEVLHQKEH
jgi:hypothetical protein